MTVLFDTMKLEETMVPIHTGQQFNLADGIIESKPPSCRFREMCMFTDMSGNFHFSSTRHFYRGTVMLM